MESRYRTFGIAALAIGVALLPALLSCTNPAIADEEQIVTDSPESGILTTGITTLEGHIRAGLMIDSGFVSINGCTTNLLVKNDSAFEQVIVLDQTSNEVKVRLFLSTGDTVSTERTLETSEPCTFLSQELLNTALAAGMVVSPGNDPWNIEGRYFADALDCVGSNYNSILIDSAVSNYSFQFTEQGPGRPVIIDQLSSTGADSIAQGKGFLIGHKDAVTLFFYEDHVIKKDNEVIPVVWSRVLSAKVEARGLTSCRIAAILTGKGDDPNRQTVPVGSVRLYAEADDLVERVAMYPYEILAKRKAENQATMAEDM